VKWLASTAIKKSLFHAKSQEFLDPTQATPMVNAASSESALSESAGFESPWCRERAELCSYNCFANFSIKILEIAMV